MKRPDDSSSPRSLGNLIGEALGKKGLPGAKRKQDRIRRAWATVAPERIADHTRVRSLRRSVLSIDADSAALAHELAAFHKASLLTVLNERYPEFGIEDLHFRQGDFSPIDDA